MTYALADYSLGISVRLWMMMYREYPPLLLKPLYLHQEIFLLEASDAGRGAGVVQDCTCQASSSCPVKGAAVGLSLPSGPQVQDQRT